MIATLQHHLRFSLAIGLEYEESGRAESRTVLVADQVIELSNWLAAWLTAVLIWLNGLPGRLARFDAWLDDYIAGPVLSYVEGWVADLRLMAEAVCDLGRQFSPGRIVI